MLERVFNAAGELAGLETFQPIARPDSFSAGVPAEVPAEDPDWFADLSIREPLLHKVHTARRPRACLPSCLMQLPGDRQQRPPAD